MRFTTPQLMSVLLFLLGVTNWFVIALVDPQVDAQVTTVDASQIHIDKTTGERRYRNEVFTGTAVTRYPSGTLATSESFEDGRRHGAFSMWFENGQIAYASTYQRGRRSGVASSWWDNGNRRSETYYVDDRPHGVAWHWYRTGEKYKRFSFDNGAPTGLQQAWRLNGKLYSNFEYRNGRAYGLRNANLCVELDDEVLPLPTT
ncbi:MAG: toxin-antitoxin system YwqK family antitoxin [Pseudomonadota bacterium]